MNMKGSITEQNLMKAFAGESQARNRYTFDAAVAADEGYRQIANIFLETADNERSHAFQFFGLLEGGTPEFTASYPAGPVHTTVENLRAAAEGELLEWETLYPDFARIAEEEGFKKAAATFRKIAGVEVYHERRYRRLLASVEAARVFRRDGPTLWKCEECGHVHEGAEAPRVCPVCGKPQAYFEVYCENY
jgi:rubrerythrin